MMTENQRMRAIMDWHAATIGAFDRDLAYWPAFLAIWDWFGVMYSMDYITKNFSQEEIRAALERNRGDEDG